MKYHYECLNFLVQLAVKELHDKVASGSQFHGQEPSVVKKDVFRLYSNMYIHTYRYNSDHNQATKNYLVDCLQSKFSQNHSPKRMRSK